MLPCLDHHYLLAALLVNHVCAEEILHLHRTEELWSVKYLAKRLNKRRLIYHMNSS
jgi:hypothetical protein